MDKIQKEDHPLHPSSNRVKQLQTFNTDNFKAIIIVIERPNGTHRIMSSSHKLFHIFDHF